MALKVQRVSGGPRDVVFVISDVTFSNSYPAGGEALNPSDFELSKILFVAAELSHAGQLQAFFDPSTTKLRLVGTGSGVGAAFSEVATASNQSAVTARVIVAGVK